jgi:ferredoxin-type protein NapG
MPSDDPIERQPPHDRRHFFRSSLARLLGPAAEYVEQRLPIKIPVTASLLRPPGALPEYEFLETCFRCGSCADRCPAQAIQRLESRDDQLTGTPYLLLDEKACVVCDDLACMRFCPSQALRLVERSAIRIGLAEVDHARCERSRDGDCTICVDACPIGETAIRIDADGRVAVVDPREAGAGCVGCGVCQERCPVRPIRAIRVFAY